MKKHPVSIPQKWVRSLGYTCLCILLLAGLIFPVAAVQSAAPGGFFAIECMTQNEDSQGNFGHNIWVVNTDGTNLKRITDISKNSDSPDISKDGKLIVFCRRDYSANTWRLYREDPEGGTPVLMSSDNASSDPAWGPDNNSVVYSGAQGIERLAISSSRVLAYKLTQDNGIAPAWSPDGRSICYIGGTILDSQRICIIDTNGSSNKTILDGWYWLNKPSWSPDGKQLVFSGEHVDGDSVMVYRINADGTGLVTLVQGSYPVWLPVGNTIAYLNYDNISVMNPNGGQSAIVVDLTALHDTYYLTGLSWGPGRIESAVANGVDSQNKLTMWFWILCAFAGLLMLVEIVTLIIFPRMKSPYDTGAKPIDNAVKAKLIKHYFNAPLISELVVYIVMTAIFFTVGIILNSHLVNFSGDAADMIPLVTLFTLVIWVFMNIIPFIRLLSNRLRASPKQMDDWFNEDLQNLQKNLLTKWGIDESELISNPVIFYGTAYKTMNSQAKALVGKPGIDGLIRLRVIDIFILNFTETELLISSCVLNRVPVNQGVQAGQITNETVQHLYYKDIRGISITPDKFWNNLVIAVSGGGPISVPVYTATIGKQKVAVSSTGADEAVRILRNILQERNSRT
jgi:hypothetical protein